MWVALGAIFSDLRYSGARAVVLTGADGEFCSGADLSGAGGRHRVVRADGQHARRHAGAGRRGARIHSCPVPVDRQGRRRCASVPGLGLALAADLTWCSDRARFSAIFAKRGISLDFGTSWLLRQRLPVHKAKELALTAKIVSGPEAFELGLVNAVVPVGELDAATQEVVDTIAGGPPVALSLTKRELDNASASSLAHALETEAAAQSVNVQTDDMREALMAYIERRPPTFTGR